jgi:anti-anti-sigma regulatory factor
MAVAGTLDVRTSLAFADYIDETLRSRPSARALILDLTDLAVLTRGGLRAIHRARGRVERHGLGVVIVAEPGTVVAGALGADPTVRLFDTRRDAIAAAEPPARMSA